jgi:2-polyprenyl-3-methyl-5-hydroxy-6-metoxy-1,4-benzoquinol methylase
MAVFFPSLNSAATWDREYARGDWDRLNLDSELGRYAIVFAHICAQSAKPSVLDIGCGPGRLLEMVSRVDYDSYVGLDVSAEAVERARSLGHARSSFFTGFAEDFQSDQRFGVIVFNEVLYYLKQPAEVLKRYAGLLRDDGRLVVSMYDCMPARSVWRSLKQHFEITQAARVTNHLKHTWDVRVVRPRVS